MLIIDEFEIRVLRNKDTNKYVEVNGVWGIYPRDVDSLMEATRVNHDEMTQSLEMFPNLEGLLLNIVVDKRRVY